VQFTGYRDAVINDAYSYVSPPNLSSAPLTVNLYNSYLPIVLNSSGNLMDGRPSIMLGSYADGWLGDQKVIDTSYHALDDWSGKKESIVGMFSKIEVTTYLNEILAVIGNNGYTPFINLGTDDQITHVARGDDDNQIRSWAQVIKTFSNGGQRMVLLAPFQEMNGNWIPYKSPNPNDYKNAYARVQSIFTQAGVPSGAVRWVFAPNNGSSSGYPPFENYYPGDDRVDVVAFSSYNFGYNPH
jgi:hypothetical protein